MTRRKSLNPITALACAVSILFAGNAKLFAQAMRVLGADISYWNCGTSSTGISQSNWNTAYSTGNRLYVFLRATRGGTTGLSQTSGTPGNPTQETLSRRYDDSRFLQNITRATTAGMLAGPYHFGRPDNAGNTGTDEADHFIEMAGVFMRPGYLMPMYDMEAGSGGDTLAQFAIDFSDRIYAVMQIRPCIYINGNYSSILQGATAARRDLLAKPATASPSVISPAYPMLWDARYSDNTASYVDIPVQTGSPKTTYTTLSVYYGPWDDYGNTDPWSFWQYASVVSIPGFNAVDNNVDGDVSHGDIEYVRNYLVPAVWLNNSSGDWSNLTNWNSGQPATAPVPPSDQATPYSYTASAIPVPRLPGASGSGPTSGQYDTVILERPSASIIVTVSTGNYNIRKLYMREALNITGGSLTVNYDPEYRADDSADVLHGGPISAQFSGPVALSNGTFTVHTLQVDTNRVFTLAGGTLTFDTIKLMPNSSAPAKIVFGGNVNLNARSNVTAIIAKGSGSGTSGSIDLGGATRTLTVGNGTNDIDVSIIVPISNGGLEKAGAGTLQLTNGNTYAGGTTVSAGRLSVINTSGSGTGTGPVTVNGGVLTGTGIISGAVTVNSGGTIAPGTSTVIGHLTFGTTPIFNGTNFFRINRNGGSSLADSLTRSGGTFNYGGTLVVTNVGATLVGGEVFSLFSASTYTGAFAATNLPALSGGLNWYLGNLVVNGTIKVNRSPVANSSFIFTNDPTQVLKIPLATLTNNVTDADGDAITVSGFSPQTTNGVTLVSSNGFLLYSNSVSVPDRFNYTLSDGHGGSTTGLVQIAASAVGRFSTAVAANGSSITLHLTGRPGWTYYIDRSTNLPIWMTISTNVMPGSGSFDFTDGFQDLDGPPVNAYYRLSWPPE